MKFNNKFIFTCGTLRNWLNLVFQQNFKLVQFSIVGNRKSKNLGNSLFGPTAHLFILILWCTDWNQWVRTPLDILETDAVDLTPIDLTGYVAFKSIKHFTANL